MPFVKLDCTMIDKSIWSEDSETRVVWITLLAMADADGLVEAAIPGIASRSKVSLEYTEKAIEKFQQPDKYSSNLSNEGRRIERIDGGFKVLNYQQYRDKDYTAAARQRKHRALSLVTGVTSPHTYMLYASDILSYLNLKTGKKFKNNKEILKRLRDGHTVDELKSIIDTKITDPHFIDHTQYLNPVTLFRKCHIDNYLNQTPEDFKSKKPSTAWGGIAPSRTETNEEYSQRMIGENKNRIKNLSEYIKMVDEARAKYGGESDPPTEKKYMQIKKEIKEIEEELADLEGK